MSLLALTREVSPSINACELSFHTRDRIDVAKAIAQHQRYQECLAELGAHVITLPAEPELPDAVFVEDPALVFDEVAIISNMGAPSRRPEAISLTNALARYRPLKFLREPATLDGGDVLRVERSVFVGLSRRTNSDCIAQLREILDPFGYEVRSIEMSGCLHLKSACSYLGNNTLLVNCAWIDLSQFPGFDFIEIAVEEPAAANVLLLNDVVIMPASFPKTHERLERRGFRVRSVDVSELQKAEAGVTCCSLIFEAPAEN